MKNIIHFCIIFSLGMTLISCSQDKLTTFKTDDNAIEFQLSNRFKKIEDSPILNRFDYGKYSIFIGNFHKSDENTRKKYAKYRSGNKLDYSMNFNRIENSVENENGYFIISFHGVGGDPSALLPTKYEGFTYFVETPNYIVKIFLKHTARRSNVMDKTEAMNYINPLLKSLKEKKTNLIY